MRFAVHVFSLAITVLLVTVLTHEQHMTVQALIIVLTFVGFGSWMLFGTLWWLIGLLFRHDIR